MSTVVCDPVSVFDRSFPKPLQREMLEVLRRAYRDAPKASLTIANENHSKDLNPHVRRARIETDLEELARKYGDVQVRNETNRSKNSHLVIEGLNIILTESFSRSRSKVVRPASFRSLNSMQNYPLLRQVLAAEEIEQGMKFNAVLLHGYRRRGGDELGFALIRFPNPGFKSYQPELIDLLDRYPQIESTGVHMIEDIPDALEPVVLKNINIRKPS